MVMPLYSFVRGRFYRDGHALPEATIHALRDSHRRLASSHPLSDFLADQLDQVIAEARRAASLSTQQILPPSSRLTSEGTSNMIIGKDAKAARQGDIYIEKVDSLPTGATEAKRDNLDRIVLARGEAHDHTHAIRDKGVCGFRMAGSEEVDYVEVGGSGATLMHEYSSGAQAEHEAIALAPGVYRVGRQREYVAADIERRVTD
jgi:hypothetical protein